MKKIAILGSTGSIGTQTLGTGEKSGFCTTVLIKDGGFAALDEAAAHQDDAVVCAGQFPCLLHMIQMSGMERVIFGN